MCQRRMPKNDKQATMDKTVIKHYVMQVIRIIDQFCNLNKIGWQMHGHFVRSLMSGNRSCMTDHPLEFVVTRYHPQTNSSPVETIATNLHVNGFSLVHKSPASAELEVTFNHENVQEKVTVILSDKFPFGFYTADAVVFDKYGISIISFSNTADAVNQCKGVALLDRILDLQDDQLRIDTMIIPMNTTRLHKEHNSLLLLQIDGATKEGYKIKALNMDITVSMNECPVCLESNKLSTQILCGHVFCINCLQRILDAEELPRCSLCRSNLTFVTKPVMHGVCL